MLHIFTSGLRFLDPTVLLTELHAVLKSAIQAQSFDGKFENSEMLQFCA